MYTCLCVYLSLYLYKKIMHSTHKVLLWMWLIKKLIVASPNLEIGKEKHTFYEKQETQREINTSEQVEWIHSEQFPDIRFYALFFFSKDSHRNSETKKLREKHIVK